MENKVYGYCRVSTRGQIDGNSLDNQKDEILNRYPNAEIIEEAFSGAKERPKFTTLLNKLQEGDTLVVTKLDRFCRTTKEGLEYIDDLKKRKVNIHILNMGMIEDNPMGELIVSCLLAFAAFERAMILERTQSGKQRAKQNPDFREGRPKKYSRRQISHALSLLDDGKTYKEVEAMTGISKSTLIRAINKRRVDQESIETKQEN
jgi:DNA invertase Pin-like site-specific DNA recombinase